MARPSLEALLQIENDPVFLQFRCPATGHMLWPLVRNQFLRQLISDLYYQQAPLLAPVAPVPKRQAAASLARALRHNLRNRSMTGDILVMGTGAGHFQREGRWFNRITDYLVQASPADTVTVEGIVDWHVPEPRWNARVAYWLPWQGAITVAGRVLQRKAHSGMARDMLEYARLRASECLGLEIAESRMEMLVGMMARKLARLPLMDYAYRRLLERVRPRLLLLEEGCYGDRSPLNQIAREMGIRVAEPQHGMVSGGHDAYCYAPLLCASADYQQCLPHDFLGYGTWWNEQINAPLEKWVIGNPHYTEQRSDFRPTSGTQTDLLLLGDGIEFQLYLDLAQELAGMVGGSNRVVLRPHPLERAAVYRRFPDGRAGNVVIDTNRDIYTSFMAAYAVAGEVSTGLFEAMGIVPRVLLWETPKARFSYPRHPFASFMDARGFIEALQAQGDGRPSVESTDIWATGWVDNYKHYVTHVLSRAA